LEVKSFELKVLSWKLKVGVKSLELKVESICGFSYRKTNNKFALGQNKFKVLP